MAPTAASCTGSEAGGEVFQRCRSASREAECTGESECEAEDAMVEGENFATKVSRAASRKPKTARIGTHKY